MHSQIDQWSSARFNLQFRGGCCSRFLDGRGVVCSYTSFFRPPPNKLETVSFLDLLLLAMLCICFIRNRCADSGWRIVRYRYGNRVEARVVLVGSAQTREEKGSQRSSRIIGFRSRVLQRCMTILQLYTNCIQIPFRSRERTEC